MSSSHLVQKKRTFYKEFILTIFGSGSVIVVRGYYMIKL